MRGAGRVVAVAVLVAVGALGACAGPTAVPAPPPSAAPALPGPAAPPPPVAPPVPEGTADGPPAPEAAGAWRVVDVVDGDTLDLRGADGTIVRVRVIGIDAPERGACGHGDAALALADVVVGVPVTLTAGAADDRDRYGRLLRYVDVPGPGGVPVDAGLALLHLGLARARYDSRDGYGAHPREAAYVAADRAAPDVDCGPSGGTGTPVGPGPGSRPDGAYRDCAEARAAGAAPVRRGEAGYGPHLDGDGDGIGCE